jgi:hypothetical protein
VKLTTHLQLVPMLRMRGATTPLPHTSSEPSIYLCTGTISILPKDYHLVEAHVAVGGRLASSDDPYTYAGGSVSSWQGQRSKTSQKVGARLSVVHWSSRLEVWRGANNSNPYKVSCYETSHKVDPPIQWVPGALFLGVNRPGREAAKFL